MFIHMYILYISRPYVISPCIAAPAPEAQASGRPACGDFGAAAGRGGVGGGARAGAGDHWGHRGGRDAGRKGEQKTWNVFRYDIFDTF